MWSKANSGRHGILLAYACVSCAFMAQHWKLKLLSQCAVELSLVSAGITRHLGHVGS